MKNVDALNTNFDSNSFDYIICSHMIHHIAYPMKFFKEMNRILKKNGKLIIHEPYCSVLFQIVTILMKHEGFNFEIDVWNEKKQILDTDDRWDGNLAISNFILRQVKIRKFEIILLFLRILRNVFFEPVAYLKLFLYQ